jgi:biotin synthase
MRKSNSGSNDTYVLTPDEVVDAAIAIRHAGIDVVFLQGGEIPRAVDVVADALPRIRSAFHGRVEVLLNLGNQSREAYARLRRAGATSYILKQETANRELFEALRHESIGMRIDCLEDLVELGYRVGVGSIVGLPGQGVADVADDLLFAARSGADMASVSPLIPAAGTPLADAAPGDVDLALNAIAVLRLLMPTALIPSVSALERLRDGGQRRGLEAGANVITINFSPERFRDRYLIYGKDRFVVRRRHAHAVVAAAGLTTTGSVYV